MKINGIVVHGRQLGRAMGFPTANVQPQSIQGSGPDGVYAAWFTADGQRRPCMLNIGSHPTLPGGGRSVEAHVFDFEGNLYGKRVQIETIAHLRGESKFSGMDELRQQLERDRENAREILAMSGAE